MAHSPIACALPEPGKARVLIVDDSAVARAVMARMIDASGSFSVTESVSTAAAAMAFLAKQTVDFILLDVQMPGTDGITALPDMLAASHGAKVVIVSSCASEGAAITLQALALGAADTLEKPAPGHLMSRFGEALVEKLRRLNDGAAVPMPAVPMPAMPAIPPAAARISAMPPFAAGSVSPQGGSDEFDIVAIGASTGGIHALSQLLRTIPPSFRLPILVTQHLPASFMPYFAAQLAVLGGRPCDVATDRLRIRPGRIIVAPGDAHVRCVRLRDGSASIRLSRESVTSGCLPSVDPMFDSLAEVFGSRVLAIVLSGMGRDGAEGALAVHAAGGCVVVQDKASSVIWGMPGAVAAQGLAQAVMPPDEIGRLAAARRRP
ncbi:chemotaxis-specific protein-glutamate methyltransferase CheB [Sphingomonas sp. GC_Shp_1]|uniref:chemotaxis-specific protein-glutamate methyltransferase CheB n=1 Tax=unclassified Sphingomonas TaxID=196159 RepID=UPI00226AA807